MTFLDLLGRRRRRRDRVRADRAANAVRPGVEALETRTLPSANLTAAEVQQLLRRAAAADSHQDAIITVVDREGDILGVRVEGGVAPQITGNTVNLVFAVDGALAEARSAAFFAADQAPLTSRTVEFLSQTTITPREVNSNPDILDPNSPARGPGFVAPVGLGGHIPPRVNGTPPVDLFGIELINRDSILHPGPDGIKRPGQFVLRSRFNANPAFIPPGKALSPPESYGFVSGKFIQAQSRGIGTLPGGIPLYKDGVLVGGIGVFFPGTTGFASAENSALSDTFKPHRPDRSLEAEFMAFEAEGVLGSQGGLPGIGLPPAFLSGVIDLAGITLPLFGPGGQLGVNRLLTFGQTLGRGNPDSGTDLPVNQTGDKYLDGKSVPDGWLVQPHAGVNLTAADVQRIIDQGIATAMRTRSQIRLPIGSRADVTFAVVDTTGELLGLYRMPDALVDALDVTVAKARNASYFADPRALQRIDRVPGVPRGVAFTTRTFRYLSQPRLPEGIDGAPPGPFSILNDHGKTPFSFRSALGHAAYFPGDNFHDQRDPLVNQNGVIFFPGAEALYKNINGHEVLVGGLGVSGDGVGQNDVITAGAAAGYEPPARLRADSFFFQGIRLPYLVFSRNPFG